jgi:hypothetical protein
MMEASNHRNRGFKDGDGDEEHILGVQDPKYIVEIKGWHKGMAITIM